MNPLTIFADPQLDALSAALLRDGIEPHRLLTPGKPVASVLSHPEPDPHFATAEIAFGQPDLESIRQSSRLKWIQVSSAGFTRYDTPEFRELVAARGMMVTNSSSVYAEACAQHVLSMMLAQSRQLPMALASNAANGSDEWYRLRNGSRSLRGQTVLILGFGGIASHLVRYLTPFEVNIIAMRRAPRGDENCLVVTPDQLGSVIGSADHVINILPDNPSSRGFVDQQRLSAMKPGVVFHNIGRGTTVDQDALDGALRDRHLGAAWLDVTEPEPLPANHPLRSAPNCFITPHTAGGHGNESETLVRHFLANFHRYLESSPLMDQIM